jgi:hypothetical protein
MGMGSQCDHVLLDVRVALVGGSTPVGKIVGAVVMGILSEVESITGIVGVTIGSGSEGKGRVASN